MIGVDLIPDEFKISHLRHRRMKYWMALIVVVFCAAVVFSTTKYIVCLKEGQVARKIVAEYNQLKNDIDRLNQEKNQLDAWQSQLALIGTLGQYVDFVQVTSFLAKNTPEMIYLETMDFVCPDPAQNSAGPAASPPKSSNMFILKETSPSETAAVSTSSIDMFVRGRALHYQVVADYLTTLRSNSLFQNVQLKRSWRPKGKSSAAPGSIQFEIQCGLMATRIGQGEHYANLPETKNF